MSEPELWVARDEQGGFLGLYTSLAPALCGQWSKGFIILHLSRDLFPTLAPGCKMRVKLCAVEPEIKETT